MFRWRKKNEGFEWHEYVRTTILVRRKQRQEKLDEARQAAVDGIKDAGRRSAMAGKAGAKSAGHALVAGLATAARMPGRAWVLLKPRVASLSDSLGRSLRSGGSAAGGGLSRGFAGLGRGLSSLGRWLADSARELTPRLASHTSFLKRPEVHLALLLIGGIALLSFAASVYAHGFNAETFFIGALAIAALALGLGPTLMERRGRGFGTVKMPTFALSPVFASVRDRFDDVQARFRPDLKGSVAVGVAAALFAGGAAYVAWGSPSPLGLFSSQPAEALEGRATVLSGDTLRIGKTTVRLSGIEAPEARQTCLRKGNRRWRCGSAARVALSRLVRRQRVTCDVPASDEATTVEGSCQVGGKDIASELVSNGHVFATVGLFSRYSGLEGDARAAKAGLWQGEAERPADYRAKRWDEASREAPDGCPIKGNITSHGRVYVLPWSRNYEKAKISPARGERWFCTEAEAKAAGWKPTSRS